MTDSTDRPVEIGAQLPAPPLTAALRAAAWDEALSAARAVLRSAGLREVLTPALVDVQALEPWIEPVAWSSGASRGWIRTSPEIALKRALCAGSGSIFEVAAVARGGERGARHLPEFHLLEWYRVDGSLDDAMQDVEAIVLAVFASQASFVVGQGETDAWRRPPPLSLPFDRIDFRQALQRTAGIELPDAAWADPAALAETPPTSDVPTAGDRKAKVPVDATPLGRGPQRQGIEAVETCVRMMRSRVGIEAPQGHGALPNDHDPALRLLLAWSELFSLWSDLAWDPWLAARAKAEPRRRGVHLVGFPPALAALSRIVVTPDGPRASRFETYVDGTEVANGYDELRDPAAQRARFEIVGRLRSGAGQPDLPLPEAFLSALASPGLPACAGVALGLERVLALALGLDDLHELRFL